MIQELENGTHLTLPPSFSDPYPPPPQSIPTCNQRLAARNLGRDDTYVQEGFIYIETRVKK